LLSLSLAPAKAWTQSVATDEDPAAEYIAVDTVTAAGSTGEDEYITDETETYEQEPFTFSYNDSIEPVGPQPRAVSDAAWTKMTADSAFRYRMPEQEKPVEIKESLWAKMLEAIFEFFAGPFGTFLLWMVIAAVVILLIWRIVQHNGLHIFGRKNTKLGGQQQDEMADDFIPESWEDIIHKAEQVPDYRLAVRHSYRHILLLLHERGLITYSPSGSNYEYASVLWRQGNQELYTLFTQLLRHYEYAWYGGFAVEGVHYQSISNVYKQLKQKIV